MSRISTLCATAAAVLLSIPAQAIDLKLPDAPLFLTPSVPPLNMLVIGRDHKLYYEAYNDYTDLDGDGTLDLKFKPSITYYGYFDSAKCYTYNSGEKRFDPSRRAGALNTCTAADAEWSGNFLNYLTTARIDALRKVLYGGSRSLDTATTTVLERTYLPQDAHSWGKEYFGVDADGYDITQYSSLPLPSGSGERRHLFANTTELNGDGEPLLRVLQSRTERVWNWVSIERPVAGREVLQTNGSRLDVNPTDYSVRVAVCVDNLREDNCKAYGNGWKPIGLLQEFGENNSMYFGLITGSYQKNTSGGVLRRRMDSIADEINADGTFKTAADDAGIIATLNRMRVTGFGNWGAGRTYEYRCGFASAARTISEGECQMWGNPVAEMMYEGLRYFAGRGAPTNAYSIAFGAGEESGLPGGGLPVERDWSNPYGTGANQYPYCAKPFETVVSDINPSYDTDQLPGTSFGSFGGDTLGGMNVSALGQTIWNREFGGTQSVFIGDVNGVADNAPTPKNVSSFGNIRGLSPEEPTKRGGYYAASVAYHGRITDISSSAQGEQNVQTFSVALASPLPKIEIPIGSNKISLVPFAKSVNGSGIKPDRGTFQPTDQIVDFYVDSLTPTSGRFRVNFEDVEQGADHDMDAITIYEYTVKPDNTVSVTLTSEYAYGGITQHMGYVISGTTRDGVYLEVLDKRDGNGDPDNIGLPSQPAEPDGYEDVDYYLDTPDTFTGTPPAPSSGTGRWNDGKWLPFTTSRTFTAGSTTGATLLKDPLWYAAKWGGFKDTNDNDEPDLPGEWDLDRTGGGANVPDNYFLVTNALKLSEQLRQAFQDILAQSGAAAAASVNSGSITTTTRVYRAKFDSSTWTGELSSFAFDNQGKLRATSSWDASRKLPAYNSRQIITVNTPVTGVSNPAVPFRWDNLDATRKGQLSAIEQEQKDFIDYLRGRDTLESATGLRPRGESKIGDIISSAPLYVGAPRSRYQDIMPEGASYREYSRQQRNRNELVYVGANDGMLHAFDAGGAIGDVNNDGIVDEDASGGREVFAFIPKAVFRKLKELPNRNYKHLYYVDGSPNANDVYFGGSWRTVLVGGLNQGGQGVYALDVTNPALLASAEANAKDIYLWEFTDENDKDLGFTYSQPAIVRLQNGVWAAVFGNGYNNMVADGKPSETGNAVLYVVNIATGAIIRKFDTGVGISDPASNNKPNGMGTPVMVDTDGDRVIDHAYAGDLLGNLWKFDLRSTNDQQWDFAFKNGNKPQPLFQATSTTGNVPQPITVRPEVTRGPFGAGVMVLFGTGKFLETTDTTVPTGTTVAQSLYGVLDTNTYTASDRVLRTNLTAQTITAETTGTRPTRTTSKAPLGGRGFYLDLVYAGNYKGERSVTDPLIRGDRVIFTTLIPNSQACTFGGGSWLMVLDLLSGSRLPEMPLDRDGDGDIDQDDVGPDANGDGIPDRDPISGVGTNDEIWWRPEGVLCLSDDCENDQLLTPGSSGTLSDEQLRSVRGLYGRQSWRQLK